MTVEESIEYIAPRGKRASVSNMVLVAKAYELLKKPTVPPRVGHGVDSAGAAVPVIPNLSNVHSDHFDGEREKQIPDQLHREGHARAQDEAAREVLDDGIDAQVVPVPSPVDEVYDGEGLAKRRDQDVHVREVPVPDEVRQAYYQQGREGALERDKQQLGQFRQRAAVLPEAPRRRRAQFEYAGVVRKEGLQRDVIDHAQVPGQRRVRLPRLLGQRAQSAVLDVEAAATVAAQDAGQAGTGEDAPRPGARVAVAVAVVAVVAGEVGVVVLGVVLAVPSPVGRVAPQGAMGAVHLAPGLTERPVVVPPLVLPLVLAVVLVILVQRVVGVVVRARRAVDVPIPLRRRGVVEARGGRKSPPDAGDGSAPPPGGAAS